MFDLKPKERGVALLVVLATILVVVILANIVLNIMVSQSRFTHHKVNRIQAEYAAWAAINFAQEMLRTGAWTPASCPGPGGCPLFDGTFPTTIVGQTVTIILAPPGGACAAPVGSVCVSAQVDYVRPTP